MIIADISNYSKVQDAYYNKTSVNCPECKKEFLIKDSSFYKLKTGQRISLFCSKKCSSKGRYISNSLQLELNLKCHICDNNYTSKLSRNMAFGFCSKECLNKYIKLNPERKNVLLYNCICSNPKDSRSEKCFNCLKNDEDLRLKETTLKDYITMSFDSYSLNHKYNKVRWHARTLMSRSNIKKECKICNFKYGIEVCHIKPISLFSENTKISEINSLNNLIYLCRNHHYMLDNNIEPEIFTNFIHK